MSSTQETFKNVCQENGTHLDKYMFSDLMTESRSEHMLSLFMLLAHFKEYTSKVSQLYRTALDWSLQLITFNQRNKM